MTRVRTTWLTYDAWPLYLFATGDILGVGEYCTRG